MFRQIVETEVERRWKLLAPRVQRAIEHNDEEYTAEDIYDALVTGELQMWALESIKGDLNSICVTQIIEMDRMKSCLVVIAEGYIDTRWGPAINALGDWAKQQGCKRLEARARPGWARKAAAFGFHYLHTTIAKDL